MAGSGPLLFLRLFIQVTLLSSSDATHEGDVALSPWPDRRRGGHQYAIDLPGYIAL
jgi:hypothetical protein